MRTPPHSNPNQKQAKSEKRMWIKVEKDANQRKKENAPLANLWNLLEEIRPLDLLLRRAPCNVIREHMSEDGL
jgi:hypothetical protein